MSKNLLDGAFITAGTISDLLQTFGLFPSSEIDYFMKQSVDIGYGIGTLLRTAVGPEI